MLHNVFIDQMLLYRGMQPLGELLGDWTLRERRCLEDAAPPEAAGAVFWT